MEYLPNIINSPVVGTEHDMFWNELPPETGNLTPADTLVISISYEAGSSEEVQLQKILQACKLQQGDYNIVKIAETAALPWYKLRDALKPKTILLFGVTPQQLGITAMFRLFAPNHFNDCKWVASPSLTELEKQPEAKKQLWQYGLKPVFDNPGENT